MIKLNRLTDYAVVALAQMARQPARMRTATDLAQESGVPPPTVAKMLKALASDGVLSSRRGASGGYTLARDPESINMAEIIGALEGPISLTACVDGAEGVCGVEAICPMRGNWNKVNAAIRAALESVSLSDMAVEPRPFVASGRA